MTRHSIFVLYEHGYDYRPFGSAFIRLLRPLSYPPLVEQFSVSSGTCYDGQPVDAVIIDRLWRPDVTPALIEELIQKVRSAGAKLIYSLDDNFLDLYARKQEVLLKERVWIVERLLNQADAVWVTTPALRERYLSHNQNIAVIPHALDERLIVHKSSSELPFSHPLKIGYMGTFTHDQDLRLVLPSLQEIKQRYGDQVQLQVIGAATQKEVLEPLSEVGVRFQQPSSEEAEYPLFMLWFTSRMNWDIALAPLVRSPFTDCKSDIKFLDYSAVGAAGIYSRVPAYMNTIRNGENGLLVDNEPQAWTEAIEALIIHPELRQSIVHKAEMEFHQNRTLVASWEQWAIVLHQLIDSTK